MINAATLKAAIVGSGCAPVFVVKAGDGYFLCVCLSRKIANSYARFYDKQMKSKGYADRASVESTFIATRTRRKPERTPN